MQLYIRSANNNGFTLRPYNLENQIIIWTYFIYELNSLTNTNYEYKIFILRLPHRKMVSYARNYFDNMCFQFDHFHILIDESQLWQQSPCKETQYMLAQSSLFIVPLSIDFVIVGSEGLLRDRLWHRRHSQQPSPLEISVAFLESVKVGWTITPAYAINCL